LEAFKAVKAHGLVTPDAVREASQEYMDESNPVKGWLENNYSITKDPNDRRFQIGSSILLKKYEEDTNHKISPDKFKSCLMLCGLTRKKESHNFTTKWWNDNFREWVECEGRAGQYWCGLLRNGIPEP
jgi:hypothetical protein